ncbi:MAG: hypothetical protein HY075_14525, partial [Deltaproteobacteria bacterium]|nr:hypothetical protein [Deltaproteobacteria bacterium]
MLTLETLAARLRTWSARHRANARADVSPIQLYQELFALTHELKSSVQLTEDTAVQALDPVITESDARLRQLAYDELELAPADNAALRK